jgi:hypothetical protein
MPLAGDTDPVRTSPGTARPTHATLVTDLDHWHSAARPVPKKRRNSVSNATFYAQKVCIDGSDQTEVSETCGVAFCNAMERCITAICNASVLRYPVLDWGVTATHDLGRDRWIKGYGSPPAPNEVPTSTSASPSTGQVWLVIASGAQATSPTRAPKRELAEPDEAS